MPGVRRARRVVLRQRRCRAGTFCSGGTCAPCGGSGLFCCPGNLCDGPGLICEREASARPAAGAASRAVPGPLDTERLVCQVDGECGACGGEGEQCCAGDTCPDGRTCDPDSGRCLSCGGRFQSCCETGVSRSWCRRTVRAVNACPSAAWRISRVARARNASSGRGARTSAASWSAGPVGTKKRCVLPR